MEKILCIDLGTGNSCMSVIEGGEAKIIPNAQGERTTPSIVAWTDKGERLVGTAAKRQAVINNKRTVYEVKRFIGKKYDECLEDIKRVSYDVIKAPNGDCRIKIGEKEYSPEEISSFILTKLRDDAQQYLGKDVTISKMIITCPAYFNDSQRGATKIAAQLIPGSPTVEVIRVLSEPTAAALYYGSKNKEKIESNYKLIVVDSGSGTLDVSAVECDHGVFEIKAVAGNTSHGGKDYDQRIMDWIITEFKNDTGINLSNDSMSIQRIKEAAEQAKIALSTSETTDINLPFIAATENGPQHLIKTLTRAKFEQLVYDLNEQLVAPCKQVLADSKIVPDKVLLVGGTTRIPSVQRKIKDIFGIEPSKDVNPDEAVSLGAAIQSGVITGETKDILLLDVTPLTLSICTNGQIATPMIDRNTTIPCKKTQTFTNASPMQSMATVLVGQGERKMFNDNKLLGQFNVEITPCPVVGQAQIEITYDIDANGILTVSAKDIALNKVANITITNSSGLSEEEIEKAKADAEKYAEEDKKRVELVQLKNSVDGLCGQIEKAMKDAGDKISEDEKKPVNEAMDKLKESAKSDEAQAIKTAMENLTNVWNPVVSKLYPQQSTATSPNGQQFSAEDLKNMFGGTNGPFAGAANPFAGATGTNQSSSKKDDGPIEAEVVDK